DTRTGAVIGVEQVAPEPAVLDAARYREVGPGTRRRARDPSAAGHEVLRTTPDGALRAVDVRVRLRDDQIRGLAGERIGARDVQRVDRHVAVADGQRHEVNAGERHPGPAVDHDSLVEHTVQYIDETALAWTAF